MFSVREPCDRGDKFRTRIRKYRLAPYIARFCGHHISGSTLQEGVQNLVLSIIWSPSRRRAISELDENYRDDLSDGSKYGFLFQTLRYSEFRFGWKPLHFLAAWNLAALSDTILSTPPSDVEVLVKLIRRKWRCRSLAKSSSIVWNSDDLRLDPMGRLVTPLHIASIFGNVEVARVLLSKGAEVDIHFGQSGISPLISAASNGGQAMVKLLLENGADVNGQGGYYGNVLQAAAGSGHEEIVKLLLEKGPEVNAQGGKYGNALQAAAGSGHEEIVKLLLEKGAEVNAQGEEYGNALQAAARSGREEIVKLLLEKGADVNAQRGYYGNALQAAAGSGREEIVKLLLEKGADVNTQGGEYGNALQAAVRFGHEEIVKLLLEKGAEVNAQGGY